jgi:periplasmic copper chaperone A
VFAAVRRVGLGLAVGIALLTSACAAGQRAHTAEELPTIAGANADLGTIHLRSALIDAPTGTTPFFHKGSDLTVKLVIVNSGTKPDKLVSITSPAVTSWGSYATTSDAEAVVSAASASPQPSGSATASAPLPTPARKITIGPGQRVGWGTPESPAALLFSGTKQELHPGTTVPVTFTFQNAGTITVEVPIALTANANSSVIPAPSSSVIE